MAQGFQNLEGPEATQALEDKGIFILDVRTPREFQSDSLERAVLIPVDQLEKRAIELPKEKSAPILVYCAHGVRSVFAARYLENLGYTKIFNLLGGITHYRSHKS